MHQLDQLQARPQQLGNVRVGGQAYRLRVARSRPVRYLVELDGRSVEVDVDRSGRFELRLADGAANPYLLQAAVFAGGLDGIRNKRDPGERLDINMYTDGHKAAGAKKLPLNLLDALRALERSAVLKDAFGEKTLASYIKLKTDDWNAYSRHLTDWERQTTLDC